MSENDRYFGCAVAEEAPVLDGHLRTIKRLERQNFKLKLALCWVAALTFAVAFGLGYVMGERWR